MKTTSNQEQDNQKALNLLFKSGVIAFLLGIVGYIIMFFFRLLAARYLGADDYGLFSLVETIFGIIAVIAGLGLAQGIPRYIPYYKEKQELGLLKGYKRFVFSTGLASSLLFGVALFLLADTIAGFFNVPESFGFLLQIVAVAIPLKTINGLLKKTFLAEKDVFYYKFSDKFVEQGLLLVGLGIVWWYELSLLYLVIVFTASFAASLLFNAAVYRIKFHKKTTATSTYEKKRWIYFSLPLLLTGMFGYLISWSDNLIIGIYLTPAELGIYAVAYSLAKALTFGSSALSAMFLPVVSELFAKKNYQGIQDVFKKTTSWVFGATLPAFLIILFYTEEILYLLFGAEYVTGSLALTILAIGMLINLATVFATSLLTMDEKTKPLFYVKILVTTINVLLNIALIPLIGIEGAAITSAISITLQSIIFLYLSRKYHAFSFDYTYLTKFVAAGIPAILLSVLLFELTIPFYAKLVLAGAAYIGLYTLFLILLKTFDEEDKRILQLVFKKLRG